MHEPSPLLLTAFIVGIFAAQPGAQALNGDPQTPRGETIRFEVASLKERNGLPPPTYEASRIQVSPGRIIQRCATLKSLMSFAYRLDPSSPVNGLPSWAYGPCSNVSFGDDTL
jgi:hypothetical protein